MKPGGTKPDQIGADNENLEQETYVRKGGYSFLRRKNTEALGFEQPFCNVLCTML